MRIKSLFIIVVLLGMFSSMRSQCNASQTASLVISTVYSVAATSDPAVIKVCNTGIAYDTVSGLNRVWYLESGARLYLKNNPTTLVYMKSGSMLINKGGASAIMAYTEPSVTITNLGFPSVTNNTCTTVSFPASPVCSTTGLDNSADVLSTVSLFPIPLKDYLIIENPERLFLKVQLYNSLGVLISLNHLQQEKANVDVLGLAPGIYYISIENKEKQVTRKIVITN